MAFEFRFPDVGEGITEGEIVKWNVREGDKVEEHQPIGEIETDKAIVEMPSPKSETILKIHRKEGDTVRVGEIIVTIDDGSDKDGSTGVVGHLEESGEIWKPLAVPAVRRLAREMNVDLSKIRGTGDAGRITEEDVRSSSQ